MDEVKQAPDDFCPYVGLQPYSEADQDYFFGRERDSRIISSNLYAAPLTVLYGASGVGKSSILRAGVFPRLRTSPRTAVVIFDGWADQNLLSTLKAKCLEAIAEATGSGELQLDLSLPLDELLFLATQAFGGTLLIILDQFEEYFLYHPEAEKNSLFDVEFARAVNREDIDGNFLAAMREDSLSRLDRFRARIPNMLSNALRLRHLDASSARDAMRKPLEVYATQHPTEPRMSIEDALVEELIEEIQVEKLMIGQGGQGVIERYPTDADVRIEAPFLQLVLTRLWDEERAQGSQVLRLETLHTLGGAGHIIRTHMDSAMNALSPEEQETAADIFRYMVTPSGTKIAYTVADLEYYARSTRPLQPVLDKLAQGNVRIMRPVTSPGEPGVIRYQIYHDVLAPAVLDWRARYENSKQLLSLFNLLIEKGDMESAFQVYQDIVQRTPQQAFFPERYEVRKILGKGELGVTYLIFDREEDHLLAATILDHIYQFTKEELEQFASQMGRLSSPRISRILGFNQHRDDTYMLSEYIDGSNLSARIRQGLPLTYQEAMQIARQITEALEDGHRQNLPHLNLRPSSIMLSADGVKLVNYGISRLTSIHRDSNKPVKKYMDDYLAPEQLSGQGGNERSDIYALGTILYEMLIGHPPSVGRFYYPSEVNIEATEAVDILIDHARESDPDRRFATAEAMRTEIDRISMVSLKQSPNQVLRIALAWISERYERLTSRRGLAFLLPAFVTLLTASILYTLPVHIRLPARVILPLLLNSLVISTLFDWVIRAFARRRGLGSLSTGGSGMGAVLGLIFTLNLIVVLGFDELSRSPDILGDFFGMLTIAIFGTALALGIILAIASVTERLFKSYTSGFYWGFVVIVIIMLVLTILQQPQGLFG
jgi:FtsH-binding integral membrane protein